MRLVVALIAVVALALPARSSAQSNQRVARVSAFSLIAAGASLTVDDVATSVADALSLRPNLRFVSLPKLKRDTPRVVGQIEGCGQNVSCVANRLLGAELDLGVLVTIDTDGGSGAVEVALIDSRSMRRVFEDVAEVAKPGDVPNVVRRLVAGAFDKAGFAIGGRIAVDVEPADARVTLADGTFPDLASPHQFTLPAGDHELVAAAPGFLTARRRINVSAGETKRIRFELDAEPSVFASPWLWTAIGVAVAGGAAAGVVLATRPGGRCLCIRNMAGVCDVCVD